MPTDFLKKRYPQFFKEVAGDETVSYFAFDEAGATRDDVSGDIISEAATPTAIKLPCLVNFNPSQALRAKIGLDIKFNAFLKIAEKYVQDNSIDFKVGDRFVLPDDNEPFYLAKVFIDRQGGDDFLDYIIAVRRGINKRG